MEAAERETEEESRCVTVAEAARHLEVSTATVYALCASGRLAHCRFGVGRGAIRITPEQLQRYVRESEVGPPPDRRKSRRVVGVVIPPGYEDF